MTHFVESLIDGSITEVDGWDEAWSFARLVCCHGGNPEGNVLVHEYTGFREEDSTFHSQYDVGRRQSNATYKKNRELYWSTRGGWWCVLIRDSIGNVRAWYENTKDDCDRVAKSLPSNGWSLHEIARVS